MDENLLRGKWYTTEELALILGVDSSTLRRWRTARPPQGPPFVSLSSRVTKYNSGDVENWLTRGRIDPGKMAS
ncbi:helix-turn-helix transcriptional regulator [Umezawaea endophytica]|jgi:predicted DNA-binding transcriptional regulator AlpA|uniref:Helix-turn-helix domain-containing protein n=1 Tax=Umezawaea endophytica TaxID=1654476 RepID=A0A9X3AJV1_9PSEU|nr:helix-turn-helix domain-containing protein [Umezawaea endophytica]MCS7484561.1 helix-turn-helix domain-containing protein [Umezawaea endophytica]